MSTRTLVTYCAAWIVSMLVLATAFVTSHRYTVVEADANNAWKIDRLTGQAYSCQELEYGPFCLAAPDHIKHVNDGV